MEGPTEDGGELVCLRLWANKILCSNTLSLNLTSLLRSSPVLWIFIWLHWTDQGLQNKAHHFVWHRSIVASCDLGSWLHPLDRWRNQRTEKDNNLHNRSRTMSVSPRSGSQPPARPLKQYLQKGGCSWTWLLYSHELGVWKQVSFTELRADVVCRVSRLCTWAETMPLVCEASPGKRPCIFSSLSGSAGKWMISQVDTAPRLLGPGEIFIPPLKFTLTCHGSLYDDQRAIWPRVTAQAPKPT